MSKKSSSKASVFYAIISNTIVLVLVGIFLILYFHTNAITSILKERINILVELKNDSPEEDIKQLGKLINGLPEVKGGSTKLIPSEQASEYLGEDIGVDFDAKNSPFKDVIIFNVLSDQYNDITLKSIKDKLLEYPIVNDVIYENLVIDNIKSNLNKLSLGILILNVFFLILVIVIMYNTINLSLYADRWEIKTMEIIGARDRFIRQPYLKIAGRIAVTSFVFAAIIILFLLGLLYFNSEFVENVMRFGYLAITLFILFIISLCITIIATIRIVNNYLYQEEGDLY